MNQCPQEERIQSYLDGELSRDERKVLARHLDSCGVCTQALLDLKRLAAWSDVAIHESFSPPAHEAEIDVQAAWSKFQARVEAREQTPQFETPPSQPKRSWFTMAKKYQKWAAGTVAAVVVISVMTIPQVQAAAGDLLSIFRINKIETVKITQEDLQSIEQLFNGQEGGEKTIEGLGKFSVDEPRQSKHYESLEKIKAAGFPIVPAPEGYSLAAAGTNPSFTVHMELDTEKANKMLDQLGAGVAFDEKLNGKKFSLTMPETTDYHFRNDQTSLFYQVIGSPQLDVPADVDVDELRRTFLASPLIPSGLSKQLLSIEDWQSTLPIPFVEGQDKVEEVRVGGNNGLFIQANYGSGGTLMWQQNEKIHQLEYYPVNQDQPKDAVKAFLLDTALLYN